jgi:hypothetical protein
MRFDGVQVRFAAAPFLLALLGLTVAVLMLVESPGDTAKWLVFGLGLVIGMCGGVAWWLHARAAGVRPTSAGLRRAMFGVVLMLVAVAAFIPDEAKAAILSVAGGFMLLAAFPPVSDQRAST